MADSSRPDATWPLDVLQPNISAPLVAVVPVAPAAAEKVLSRYKGVSWVKGGVTKWTAQIQDKGKRRHLGNLTGTLLWLSSFRPCVAGYFSKRAHHITH